MLMTVFHGIFDSLDRSVSSDVARMISGKSFTSSNSSGKEKQW